MSHPNQSKSPKKKSQYKLKRAKKWYAGTKQVEREQQRRIKRSQ